MPIQRAKPRRLEIPALTAADLPAIPHSKQPSGSILQVVQGTDNSWNSNAVSANSNTTWVSQSITRKENDSKIQVIFSGCYGTNNATDTSVNLRRGSTYLSYGTASGRNNTTYTIGTDKGGASSLSGSGVYIMLPTTFSFLDSPASGSSALTYTVSIWVESGTTIYPNGDGWRGSGQQSHGTQANLILLEIAA
jgi:hypothetical protein